MSRSTLLRTLLGVAVTVAALVIAVGGLYAAADLSERGESWDGFGVFLALLVGIPALVVGALAWTAFRAARRDPARARWLGAVVGGLLMLPAVAAPGSPIAYAPLLLGVAIVATAVLPVSSLSSRSAPRPDEADRFGG